MNPTTTLRSYWPDLLSVGSVWLNIHAGVPVYAPLAFAKPPFRARHDIIEDIAP
ncbi:MAG: hypothetical protein JWQ23_400 [Herminiimonas sp.]|nr:hypothetical protein [Herminiimonas sp.]